ncbi:MAG TPA: hypothetical protein VGL81_06395 [Polyangiaceae bacterium]|jgi:hypothetical protein
MAMPNIPDDTNDASIDEVISFIDSMAERGELPSSSAVQKNSAIRNMASVLAEDEPRTARYVLANLENISLRWATKNPQFKGSTVKTYESKARAAIEAYFDWKRDPKGFKFERHGAPRAERPKEEKPPKVVAPSAPPPSNDTSKTFRYPLPGGREFVYSVPDDGLSVAEVRRIGMHLLTLAKDWEPGMPAGGADAFAVVHRD